MRLPLLLIISLFSILEINAQTNNKLNKDIDSYISKVQEQYNLPGVALAVIKNGKIIHKRYYGVANVEYSVPVDENTLFPIFSTTKVFSVIAIHQLIEQKKMSLESTISDFLDDLPEDWKKVKVKNLLTHSSGLPDIVVYETDSDEVIAKSKVYKDSIKFSVGNQFDYNQTNFWILNRILKKLIGKTLSEYIIETQFPFSKNSVVFEGNNLKVVQNLSYGYMKRENENYFLKRNWNFPQYMYGAAALNLTLNSFIDWNKKFDDEKFISEATKKQLLTPFDYNKQKYFCYGLDLIKVNEQISYGFSGGVATAFRKFTDKSLTIILLTNGMLMPTKKLNGINEVLNNIAVMTN